MIWFSAAKYHIVVRSGFVPRDDLSKEVAGAPPVGMPRNLAPGRSVTLTVNHTAPTEPGLLPAARPCMPVIG